MMLPIDLAREIATEAHRGQFRKDGVTHYIKHPEDVARRCPKMAGYQSVAWLHDVLEDTRLTCRDLIDRGVDQRIVAAVEAMTKREGQSYDDYLEQVAANGLARVVKMADMISNLADSPTQDNVRKYARGLLYLLDHPTN